MKQSEIFSVLDGYAPFDLSDAFVAAEEDAYDNSGIIIETGKDVKKALFSLDLSLESAEYAVKGGFDLVVTHHPAVYRPIRRLDLKENRALTICAASGAGVISMHLNLDIADRGIDHYIAEGLGARDAKIITKIRGENGYGRFFTIEKTTLKEYKRRISQVFGTDNVMIYGGDGEIEKVASFCGAGCDMKELELAEGADAIVSADFKHHVISAALDRGYRVIQMTHYASENYGMKRFYENVKGDLSGVYCEYFSSDKF